VEALIVKADACLYAAKNEGRNRVWPGMSREVPAADVRPPVASATDVR